MDSDHTSLSYDGRDRGLNYSEDDEDSDEPIDPRVKVELERLNSSTLEINRLEQDLQEVQAAFRQTLTESAFVLKSQANHLGKCVEKARPYYQALDSLREAQIETQKAALRFENACNAHKASKEMVALAEQKLSSSPSSSEHRVLDPALQELLNHTTVKFMESEQERFRSEQDHRQIARKFTETEREMAEHKNKLKSAIVKSRTYFELRSKYKLILEGHKKRVEELQYYLAKAKSAYSLALKNLEDISEEIHELRRSRDSLDILLDKREEGVGAETPHDDVLYRGPGIIKENCSCSSSLLSVNTSNVGQSYAGFKVALVTESVDDWQLSLTGDSSGFKGRTQISAEDGFLRNKAERESVTLQKENLTEEQEQSHDNELQKSSLTKVLSNSSSKNGDIVHVFGSEREDLRQADSKEIKEEKATELKPLAEREETTAHGCEARYYDPSRGQEQKLAEVVSGHKERTDVRAYEESKREIAVKYNQPEDLEIPVNSEAFVNPEIADKLTKPITEAEPELDLTCGGLDVDEKACEREEIIEGIAGQRDVNSRAIDDPDTSNKLTKPVTEAESELDLACGALDETACETGEIEGITGQQGVDSRTFDDPDNGDKLTKPITEAESELDLACGALDEKACETGEIEGIAEQQGIDSRTFDDPDNGDNLTKPNTETESELDFTFDGLEKKARETVEIS